MRIATIILFTIFFAFKCFSQVDDISLFKAANEHFKEAKYFSAIEELDKAIDANQSIHDYYILRGECHFQLANYRKAKHDFRHVIAEDHDNYLGHYFLGLALGRTDDFMGSIKHLRTCVELKPDYVKAYYNGAISFGILGDYFRAIDYLDRALELEPNNVRAYYNRAYWKEQSLELEEAEEDYLKAVELDPIYADAYNGLGNVHYKMGKKDEACKNWTYAHELGSIKSDDIFKQFCDEAD